MSFVSRFNHAWLIGLLVFSSAVSFSKEDDANCFIQFLDNVSHTVHGITSERGMARIQAIRGKARKPIANGKNIAFAEVEIAGRKKKYSVAVSGSEEWVGAVPMTAKRRFQTFVDRHDRSFDSEVKILENLAQEITPQTSGRIRLFSERPL